MGGHRPWEDTDPGRTLTLGEHCTDPGRALQMCAGDGEARDEHGGTAQQEHSPGQCSQSADHDASADIKHLHYIIHRNDKNNNNILYPRPSVKEG